MTRNLCGLATFALATFAGSASLAQPVTLSVSSGTATITSQTQSSGRWTVLIHVTAGSPAVFTITTATTNVAVEKIEVECDADCLMTVDEAVGGGSFSEIRYIIERSASSPESFEIDTIFSTGNVGPGYVSAEAIDQIRIGGDLLGHVSAGPRADNSDSDISLIDVGGDIIAEIRAEHGAIGSVLAGGVIEGGIAARDGVSIVEADSFSGYFNAAYNSPSGSVNRFVLRDGNFRGTFRAIAVEPASGVADPGISINGDVEVLSAIAGFHIFYLSAPMVVTGRLVAPYTGFTLPVLIGDAFEGTSTRGDITIEGELEGEFWILGDFETTIRLGSLHPDSDIIAERLYGSGGAGQIILADGPEGVTWYGDISVDGVVLSPTPHYDDEGLVGAVGQVPFALHDLDCGPENGEYTMPNAFAVMLAFYGPVTCDGGFPFIVEYLYSADPVIWADDTEHWSIETGLGTRMIGLLYTDDLDPSIIPSGREYRVRPVRTGPNPLRCDKLLTTSVVPVADFEYVFLTP